jgi:UPF0755 protein
MDPLRKPSRIVRPKTVLLLGVVGLGALAGFYLQWSWSHPLTPRVDTVVVKSGTTLRGLARQLYELDVILEPYTFTWMGYLTGRSRQLKAGEYRLRPGITAAELLDQVVAGRVIEYPLVFVEGSNFRQLRRAVESAPKLTQTLTGLGPAEIMARIGYPGVHPEGRFFPDTYYYSMGHTDAQVLARAFERMHAIAKQEWSGRDARVPLKSVDEALVLASIVEKETGRGDERPLIAGVFVNRLRKGMRLQSDPTVIYGIGPTFDGNIRLKDLRQDTPHNTYTRAGLPPTPIAMPGRDSIIAVLHPSDTQALYFVSRGDGGHVFSNNLLEHTAAVTKYQLGGRAPAATATKNGRPAKNPSH